METKPIRDPVYDYIYITPIEQKLIDTPPIQRLRFILQNSSAYLTYPSNNNSRFLHSLGVMHLAGDLFIHGLQQASKADLEDFLNDVEKYVDHFLHDNQWEIDELSHGWQSVLGDASHFAHHPAQGLRISLSPKDRLLINLLWQCVRLAALIHDVGHFPLSHLFEYAFTDFFTFYQDSHNPFEEEYNKRLTTFRESLDKELQKELPTEDFALVDVLKDFPLHEMWGSILFDSWFPSKTITDPSERCFYNVVFRLAKVISLVHPGASSNEDDAFKVFRCLHALVAGELDADRMDYCVRDPVSSGLELGAIDVTRIVRSMTLVKDSDSGQFAILPDARALSAIESFFHQRYLIYQYLVYHHNVVRLDAVAQEIIFRLLNEAASEARQIRSILGDVLDQFGFWTRNPNKEGFHFLSLGGFEYYEDAWLRTLMSQCLLKLEGQTDLPPNLVDLPLLLRTFLYRQTYNIVSMWKREPDYHETIDQIYNTLKDGTEITALTHDAVRELLSPKAITKSLRDALIVPIKEELEKLGVILLYSVKKPKVPHISSRDDITHERDIVRVLVHGTPQPYWNVSSYLSSLGEKPSPPTIFIAFLHSRLKKDDDEHKTLRKECKNVVRKHITSYVKKQLTQGHV